MAATAIWFRPSDFYAVEQMPLRVIFLTTTMGLTLWLMVRLNTARDEAEDLAKERASLAEMGRVVGSTLELGQVYGHFAVLVQELVPHRKISMSRFNPVSGKLERIFADGESAIGRSQGMGGIGPESDADLAGILINLHGALYGGDGTGQHTSMAVPLISGGMVVGTMSLEALAAATYSGRDLDRNTMAHQISSAIESSRLAEVLVSSEKRLRSVLDSSRDAVITIEAAGYSTGVNAGAVSMIGYPSAQFEGKELRELAPTWSLSGSSLWEAGDSPGRDVEIGERRSNGSSFTVEAVTARLPGQEGSVTSRNASLKKTPVLCGFYRPSHTSLEPH